MRLKADRIATREDAAHGGGGTMWATTTGSLQAAWWLFSMGNKRQKE